MKSPRTMSEALVLLGNMTAIGVSFWSSLVVFLSDQPFQALRTNLPILLTLNALFVLPMLAFHILRVVRSSRQWEHGLETRELVLGESLALARQPIILREIEREGHLGIFGATRSGKSSLAESLATQDIQAGRTTIVIDPHGSMTSTLAANSFLAGRAPMLLQADDAYVGTLNLLEPAPGYTAYDAARIVAEGLSNVYIPFQEELPVRLRNVLETAAYFLACADEGYTLLELPRYILQRPFREYLARRVASRSNEIGWLEPEHALTVLAWLDGLTPTQLYQQNQSSFVRLAGLLSSPDSRRIFGHSQSSISFEQVLTESPFLIAMQRERLHHGAKLANGMILAWLTHRLQTRTPGPNGFYQPIYLYLDELAEVAPAIFESLLLVAGKRSVRLTILAQAQTMLDPGLRDSLMGNLNGLTLLRSNGPGVDELAELVFIPPTFDGEVAFGGPPTPRHQQLSDLAVQIRSLATHHYLFRSGYRPGVLIHGRTQLDHRVAPVRAAAGRDLALRHSGFPVELIDREIRERVAALNARFGPLQGYRDDRPQHELAPW